VSGWQPIETAPKEAEAVLLCVGRIFGTGRYRLSRPMGAPDYGGWYFDGASAPSCATHWMPLPEPPPIPRQYSRQ
jgi:hypothetical protein